MQRDIATCVPAVGRAEVRLERIHHMSFFIRAMHARETYRVKHKSAHESNILLNVVVLS